MNFFKILILFLELKNLFMIIIMTLQWYLKVTPWGLNPIFNW
jgi:hypothetical protein